VLAQHLSFLETSEGLIYIIQLIRENLTDDVQEINRLESVKASLSNDDQNYLQALIEKRDALNDQIEALKMQYKVQTGEDYFDS
jgi:hypothetical protein